MQTNLYIQFFSGIRKIHDLFEVSHISPSYSSDNSMIEMKVCVCVCVCVCVGWH